MSERKVVSIRVNGETWKELRLRSLKINKPTQEIVERLIETYLRRSAKKGG
jgi:hypothetical protein